MLPGRRALLVHRAGSGSSQDADVVPQLCTQAQGIGVIVVFARLRLVANARVEGLGFPVKGITSPDAVTLATRPGPSRATWPLSNRSHSQ